MRAKGQFWGSVITDDEVDALLRAHGEIDYPAESDGLDDAISASTAYRDAPKGKLEQLRAAFDLDGDEMDLILLTLAPEISAGMARFSPFNDNLNKPSDRRPRDTDFASGTTAEIGAQARLLPGSPLIQNRLLLLNPPEGMDTHTSRRVHPAPSLRYGYSPIDPLRWPRERTPCAGPLCPVQHEGLEELTGLSIRPSPVRLSVAQLIREGAAMAIARTVKRPLIRVDLSRCKKYLKEPFDLIRDLRLDGAIPYLINSSTLMTSHSCDCNDGPARRSTRFHTRSSSAPMIDGRYPPCLAMTVLM